MEITAWTDFTVFREIWENFAIKSNTEMQMKRY